uniref:Uncharacterized protein n=1 Tax=Rhizophora mucronata TaxID=61149 RepID=A0A2P2QBD2_RHIMU
MFKTRLKIPVSAVARVSLCNQLYPCLCVTKSEKL